MIRGLVATLALLLGGCSVDASGVGDGGDAGGSSGRGSDTGVAPATLGGTATGESSDASSGSPLDDTGSTGGTSSTGTTTADGTATGEGSTTGDPPAPLCPAQAALAACYDFAGLRGGTLLDQSGNGNDGTASAVGVVMGPFGTAATFDARSEIAVPDSASLDLTGEHTLEAWIRVDALPPPGDRYGVLDKEGQYSLFVYDSDDYRCDSAAGTLYAGPVVLGSWTHVACVYDGTSLRLYVDGMEWGSTDAGGALNTTNTDPMAIGDTSPEFDDPLAGAIGGVRVWSTALAPAALCEAAGPACTG